MKLSIGTCIYSPQEKRHTNSIDSLLKIKNLYPFVNLYNITFQNEDNKNSNFIHLPHLKTNSKDITGDFNKNGSLYPISFELFDILAETDCDYFLYINNDILVSKKLIELIKKEEYESYSFSRFEIEPINSINDEIKPIKIEIAGFDAWCVKKNWWLLNKSKFRPYIIGQHLWDIDYALTLYNNSNSEIYNLDFYIGHETHERKWNDNSKEALYNRSLWDTTPYQECWSNYIYKHLIYRTPHAKFFNPLPNEQELKIKFLKTYAV